MMQVDIEKLKSSNDELKEIVNNSWDGIAIIDKSSKFLYVNNAFSPILGFTKEEFLSNTFLFFITNNYKKDFRNLIKENIKNRYKSEVQVVCKRKDGKNVYLQITISLMLNKEFFVVNARDITKQISDDEILDSYVISNHTDTNGIITKVSKAFCLLSGYSEEEIIGRTHSFMRHPDMKDDIFEELWETLIDGNEWSGKIKNLRKNSGFYWVDIKIKPIHNKYGDVTGYTALMFDITNELLLEDDKKALQVEMGEARDTIRQKDKILAQQAKLAIMAETLKVVSHEWRQPLNFISIQAQKIELDYSLDDEINEEELFITLNSIKDKALELSGTIEDFNGFINPKSEKINSNASDIIENAIKIFTNNPDGKKIAIIKEYENTPTFNTYANELSTVLLNIFINAKEAILKNNIKKGVIKITVISNKNSVVFEINDNAKGISDDVLDKVFEPYFSTKEAQHGVGLGLYMCKTIIEMHFNGTITIKSDNNGATITIALPII